jgi:hypothetical protein
MCLIESRVGFVASASLLESSSPDSSDADEVRAPCRRIATDPAFEAVHIVDGKG